MAIQIFDGHIHITNFRELLPEARRFLSQNPAFVQKELTLTGSSDSLIRVMDSLDIARLVMVNYVSPDIVGFTEKTNDWAAEFSKPYRDRLIPMGSIHPRLIKSAKKEFERLIFDLEMRALKLHPVHQLVYPNEYRNGLRSERVIYEMAEEHGIPVLIHTGTSMFPGARNVYGDPLYIDDVAVDFPRLRIVIAHGGRPIWMRTAFFLARRHQNVYMDVSSIPPKSILEYFPRLDILSDKAIYGSDWPSPPAADIQTNAEQVRTLNLSEEDKRKLLFENAGKIYTPP